MGCEGHERSPPGKSAQLPVDRVVGDPEPLGNNMNCYGSPTAVVEPGRVYAYAVDLWWTSASQLASSGAMSSPGVSRREGS